MFERILNSFTFLKLKNDKDPGTVEAHMGLKEEFEKAGGSKMFTNEEMAHAVSHVENGPIWEKAKEAVQKEYGHIKWPVVMYVYEKMGGKK